MTVELAPAFAARGVTLISLHPPALMDTTMVEFLRIPPRTTVEPGRDEVLRLTAVAGLEAGEFNVEGKVATPHPQAADTPARARMMRVSAALTGVAPR